MMKSNNKPMFNYNLGWHRDQCISIKNNLWCKSRLPPPNSAINTIQCDWQHMSTPYLSNNLKLSQRPLSVWTPVSWLPKNTFTNNCVSVLMTSKFCRSIIASRDRSKPQSKKSLIVFYKIFWYLKSVANPATLRLMRDHMRHSMTSKAWVNDSHESRFLDPCTFIIDYSMMISTGKRCLSQWPVIFCHVTAQFYFSLIAICIHKTSKF